VSFWRYLTLAIREMLNNLIVVSTTTWALLIATFAGFALLHRFFRATYVSIAAVVITCVIILVLSMVAQIVRIKKQYHSSSRTSANVASNPRLQHMADSVIDGNDLVGKTETESLM